MKDKFSSGREIRRSEAERRELANLDDQIGRLQAQRRQREEAHRARQQTLIGQVAIAAGLTELPASVIAAGLRFVAHHGHDAATAERWIAEFGEAADSSPPRRVRANTPQDWNAGVRVSANAALDAKEVLRGSGLAWNGVERMWTGRVDGETQNRLRDHFGDRLETRSGMASPPPPSDPDQP